MCDPKRIIGAYLVVGERVLFEVIDTPEDGDLVARNCHTGYVLALNEDTITASRLVRSALEGQIAELEDAAQLAAAPEPVMRRWPGPGGWTKPPFINPSPKDLP